MPTDTSRRPGRTVLRAAVPALLTLAGIVMLWAPATAGSARPDGHAPAGGPCVAVVRPGGGVGVDRPCGDDPCNPVSPRCDPVPPPCPVLAPGASDLPVAPCEENAARL